MIFSSDRKNNEEGKRGIFSMLEEEEISNQTMLFNMDRREQKGDLSRVMIDNVFHKSET
jgi:hypothetical protein